MINFDFNNYIVFQEKINIGKVNDLLIYFYHFEPIHIQKNYDIMQEPKILIQKYDNFYELNAYILDFHNIYYNDKNTYRFIVICYLFKITNDLINDIQNVCKCKKCEKNNTINIFFNIIQNTICLKSLDKNIEYYEEQNLNNNIFTPINKLITHTKIKKPQLINIQDIINVNYDDWPKIYKNVESIKNYEWYINENDIDYLKIKRLLKKNYFNNTYYIKYEHSDYAYINKWIIDIVYIYNKKIKKLEQYFCMKPYLNTILNNATIMKHIKDYYHINKNNLSKNKYNVYLTKNYFFEDIKPIDNKMIINILKHMKLSNEYIN